LDASHLAAATVFDSVVYISFGSERGEFVGVDRQDDGSFIYHIKDSLTAGAALQYEIDARGNPTQKIWVLQYLVCQTDSREGKKEKISESNSDEKPEWD
jgi:hypothetical protein